MEPIETIQYRGFDIEIHRDDDPQNPWEDWDNQTPMIAVHDRHVVAYGGLDLSYPPDLTRDEIKANISKFKAVLGVDKLLAFFRDDFTAFYASQSIDMINDAITHLYSNSNNTDKLDMLASLYEIKGITALSTSISGYIQGAYANVLIVATPEWMKACGIDSLVEGTLEAEANLYQQYSYGDVYGFVIEQTKDSCWGFYGDDHDKSGLLDYAHDAIDGHIANVAARKAKALKVWIKNKVPLVNRQKLRNALESGVSTETLNHKLRG